MLDFLYFTIQRVISGFLLFIQFTLELSDGLAIIKDILTMSLRVEFIAPLKKPLLRQTLTLLKTLLPLLAPNRLPKNSTLRFRTGMPGH